MKKLFPTMLIAILTCVLTLSTVAPPTLAVPPGVLDPLSIPKWVNQIYGPPPVYTGTDCGGFVEYVVTVEEFYQQILPPGFPMTKVWGYGGRAHDALTGADMGIVHNSPAPSFEAIRGKPVQVKWVNNLFGKEHMFAVDPTLHWANPNDIPMDEAMMQAMAGLAPPFPPGYNGTPYPPPDGPLNPNGWNAQSPVPIVTHLHGGEVPSAFDGGPDQWFTPNGIHGTGYRTAIPTDPNAAIYQYPNEQEPTTLWYHDHALGITRINVMSGLAGFYLLRDPTDLVAPYLPSGKYEVPLAIQDRNFLPDGSLYFPTEGNNPMHHPYWNPEFFGDVIMVNGLVWPNMDVDQAQYRFRLLDGSNARFYHLSFIDTTTNLLVPFIQIGTEGGYLQTPALLTDVLIAPGERADIIIDFSGLGGHTILLQNDAAAPYPDGDPADPNTVGQIMQFTVEAPTGPTPFDPLDPTLPDPFNPTLTGPTFPTILDPLVKTRILTLTEVMDPVTDSPLEILLDGQKWANPISELPIVGTTEEWVIVNPTADTHPIHLHLVMFQLVKRQAFDVNTYMTDWLAANAPYEPPFPADHPTQNVANLADYLMDSPSGPRDNEKGWKDTVQMNPGEVTTIRVRFAQQDGDPYPFDPTCGPGYVWHCHIIDHEDNEMMRPYRVIQIPGPVIPEVPLGTMMVLFSMGSAFFVFIGFKRLRFTSKRP